MKVYPVFIPHAGCPHRCLFCAQDRSSGTSSVPDLATIDQWLDSVLPSRGDGEVAYYGGTFSMLPLSYQEDLLGIARSYIDRGRVSSVRISTRPDGLNLQTVARLQSAGVSTVEIGCQSFSDAVLKAAKRGHSAAENSEAVRACQSLAVRVGVQLMPGLPGADHDEAIGSLRQALALRPNFLRIYPTVVLGGTALADLWKSSAFLPWSLDKAVDTCADMLHHCHRAGVPVIRLGLQQEPMLEESLLAGPYHPAFGQLVRSRLWRRLVLQTGELDDVLVVHPDDMSDVIGHRGENRDWLKNKFKTFAGFKADKTVERGFLRTSCRDVSLYDQSIRGAVT